MSNKHDSGKLKYHLVDAEYHSDIYTYAAEGDLTELFSGYLVTNNIETLTSIAKAAMFRIKDEHKNMFDHFTEMARVYTYGANMHYEWSWIAVDPNRFISALGRHIKALCRNNEDRDPDTNLRHEIHIIWNCMALTNLNHGGSFEPEESCEEGCCGAGDCSVNCHQCAE